MICPECGQCELEISLSEEWMDFDETPAFCSECCSIVWAKISEDCGGVVLNEDNIPPYELGHEIKIVHQQSPFYNQNGYVIDKDHIHYRIKIDHTLIWMPEDWVEEV